MDGNLNNPAQQQSESGTAIARTQFDYGVAVGGATSRSASATAGYVPFVDQLRHFSCEYILGLLFVACSLIFALAIPATMTRPEKVMAMVGRFMKRTLDIIGAFIGLLLSLPIFILVPILIKLDSPGPVFYSQVRVGMNRRRKDRRYHQRSDSADHRVRERRRENVMGRTFRVIKFRTMIHNAEKQCGPVWATKDDPRVTRIGRFLRKSRLDEFPQFINVLKGEMSLVGPRPERPNFVADLAKQVDNYTARLDVRPGLTGLAQVEAGYDSSLDSVTRKVDLDLEYIRTWSLWADIKILLRTVTVVLTGRGAC